MKNLYVMRVYREIKDQLQEVEPYRVLTGDHLTKKDLRIAIESAFRNASDGRENDHMRVYIFKHHIDPELLLIVRSDTRVDGSTIDAYVSIERPGSDPQQIRCMNIAS